ncbi:methylmalonyl Co-A mutase-associated GTPase MeaB [Longibacter salinarum]|uniref:Methylmalonyl Co-A mutase-associated GTPase MeaB n=1 Tax=Longibacter salinarum TaxID=1850348 RepID=A0A2A8D2S5_9BACT|nr:methylmalonyl Co-A mutase-associated GTPase MeaB [Longibacter salinarum]PEN15117.1 methylmalonyl Co-A mutase-associated GTPase MeaB [Longibacter salinarum]
MAPSNLNPNLSADPTSSQALDVDAYVEGIRGGDRVVLSRAITLIESTRERDRVAAREVMDRLLPDAGQSIRVGVTGVPGVGKSTFIEKLGMSLVDDGRKLAVLAIDPSSERTRGSILGDKTRMGRLSQHESVYIRPSPTSGSLGGVARKTRETILLCEAAGYDTIFVETVGVGQSEITVHSMVDVFLLLGIAGAGDELQGIKRGVVEMADIIAINKADGDNVRRAERAQRQYENALQLFPPTDSGWEPAVLTCSAETGDGIEDVWTAVTEYVDHTQSTGFFGEQRRRQARYWMRQTIEQRLMDDFFSSSDVQSKLREIEDSVLDGTMSSFAAADELLDAYREGR